MSANFPQSHAGVVRYCEIGFAFMFFKLRLAFDFVKSVTALADRETAWR